MKDGENKTTSNKTKQKLHPVKCLWLRWQNKKSIGWNTQSRVFALSINYITREKPVSSFPSFSMSLQASDSSDSYIKNISGEIWYIYLWFCGFIFNTGASVLGPANHTLIKVRIQLFHPIIRYRCECSAGHKLQTCVSAKHSFVCHQFWAFKREYMVLPAAC